MIIPPTLSSSSDLARERRTRLSITGSNRPCVKSPENNAAVQWTEYPSCGYVNYSSGDVSVGRFIRGIFLSLAARGRGRSTALHAAVMAMEEACEDSLERGSVCSAADALHLVAETQQLAWKRNVRISFWGQNCFLMYFVCGIS